MTWLKTIALQSLLVFSFSLFGFGGTRVRPIDSPSLAKRQFEGDVSQVEQMFIHALAHIWLETGAGTQDYEAGFALDRVGDRYVIAFAPTTYARNLELGIPINTVGTTVAIAHTHPNSAHDAPSREGHFGGGGDVFSPVPNYVVSRSGIWVTNPLDHSYRRVSGPGWSRNLRALALAGVLNPATNLAITPATSLGTQPATSY